MFAGDTALGTALLATVVAVLVVVTGMTKRAGIGVIGAMVLIAVFWVVPGGFESIGLIAPASWVATIVGSVVIGTATALFTLVVLDPLTERLTGSVHDHSIVDSVRGSLRGLVTWIVVVWILVALIEEIVFRGFLMSAGIRLLGGGVASIAVIIIVTSVLFGLAHSYQGRAGTLSTAIIGALLGATFVWSGYNLWLPIGVHGVIDTVSLLLMYGGHDRWLGRLVFPSEAPSVARSE